MTKLYEEPPPEISHSGRKLKLVLTSDVPFKCNGCKEPGCGPRYTDDKSFDLHTCCALAEDTLEHPLFANRTFKFLTEPTPPVDETVCDACGEPARGFVYHCYKKGLDLHPCCASLPAESTLHQQDGRVFQLEKRTSRPCGKCGEKYRRRRNFWAYRTYLDGEAVDLHVACMKEMARLTWKAAYENRVGGAQIVRPSEASIESMLKSLPGNARSSDGFEKFIRIAGAVASGAIAVVFGNPTGMVTAFAGALRG